MKNKTKKIIKRFFAWLYVGAMSIPLVCGLYNFVKEYHDVNAFNKATNSLLSSDDVSDVYNDVIVTQSQIVDNTSLIASGKTYTCLYQTGGSGTALYLGFSLLSFDPVDYGFPELNYVAFKIIYSGSHGYLGLYDINSYYYALEIWGTSLKEFSFVSDGSITTFTTNKGAVLYTNVSYVTSTASDMPSQVEKVVDYNLIVQKTIDDTSLSGFTDLIDIDFMALFGGVHNTPTWDFVNYYINYLINMSLILFMPEILMLFICWCRDLIYAMTDKEGGF